MDDCMEEESVASSLEDLTSDEESVGNDVVVRRTRWRHGSVCPASSCKPEGTLWNAIMNAGLQKQEVNYDCAFNQLFSEQCEPDLGIDHLIGLFGHSSSPEASPSKRAPKTPQAINLSPEVVMSALTQRGKLLAEQISVQVSSDSQQLANLEAACPQWKENVAYAMNQSDVTAVQEARRNVQQTRARLETMKESFLRAWQQQKSVLGVYELALNRSLSRLEASGPQTTPAPKREDDEAKNLPSPAETKLEDTTTVQPTIFSINTRPSSIRRDLALAEPSAKASPTSVKALAPIQLWKVQSFSQVGTTRDD